MTELRAEYVSDDVRRLNPDVFESDTQLRNAGAGPVQTGSDLEERFATMWRTMGGPKLKREYKFDEDRRWRFDFAHPASKTAIEIEGGVWSNGRHTRGSGFVADCAKYNIAALDGWAVVRLTSEMITWEWMEPILDRIREATDG